MNPESVVFCIDGKKKKFQYGECREWEDGWRRNSENLIFFPPSSVSYIKHCHLLINPHSSSRERDAGRDKRGQQQKKNRIYFQGSINYAAFCRLFWLIIILFLSLEGGRGGGLVKKNYILNQVNLNGRFRSYKHQPANSSIVCRPECDINFN